jgi:uncharacterized protein YcbK (DUF882 family)
LQKLGEQTSRKFRSYTSFFAGALTFLAALSPSLTETAVANGETRTIYLYHTHTHEQIAATYLVNGQYDQSVLKQLNWFLRDWRRDEPTNMDPRLFDVVWEAYRHAGASEPIQVVSAYRSPETNAMLRQRSRGVAKYSQHMLGKAMDTTLPGMSMSRIREIGMRMQRGGVGYYPTAGTPFVHLDVGSVRSWPRMTYDQLVRLFPDGKTVHLPTNGQPLARYEEAKAEIEANGGGAYVPAERKSKGFFAFLFGGGREEDEDAGEAAPAPSTRKQWASLAPRNSRGARIQSDEEGAETPSGRAPPEALARAESDLPRGETELSPGNGPSASATAPLPPNRPPFFNRPNPLNPAPESGGGATVASLEGATDAARADEKEGTITPLPPRRPSSLINSLSVGAPLPPPRPTMRADRDTAASALAKLADATGSTPNRRAPAAPSLGSPVSLEVASDGAPQQAAQTQATDGSSSESTLAYAALTPIRDVAQTVHSQTVHSEAPVGQRARFAGAKLTPPHRPDLVPARLDRSNFRVMVGAASASRIADGSVLGSAISAPRSAARAGTDVLTTASEENYASRFATELHEPPTGQFAPARH